MHGCYTPYISATTTKRINPGAATTSYNLFQITGDVELVALYGRLTDVTNVVGGPTVCYWNLWDGAASVDITLAAGPSLAGAALDTFIHKGLSAANQLIVSNTFQCRNSENVAAGAVMPFQGGLLVQKTGGVATYVRFTCTTLVANDCTIAFFLNWIPRYPGSTALAV